jgi:hypothetical protein
LFYGSSEDWNWVIKSLIRFAIWALPNIRVDYKKDEYTYPLRNALRSSRTVRWTAAWREG